MKIRSFLAISLLTVLLLVSCAPAEAPAPAQPEVQASPAAPMTEEPQAPPPAETEAPVIATEVPPTEAPAVEAEPEFVPRGPDLEATNPATVNLTSGELQLVEFFRFT